MHRRVYSDFLAIIFNDISTDILTLNEFCKRDFTLSKKQSVYE